MATPITASADTIAANTFGAVDPQPFAEDKPRIVSKNDNQLTGFFSAQDRVSISPQAQAKAQAEQQIEQTQSSSNATEQQKEPSSNEFIQVSSSIGKAASSGNMNRDEAMAIYQKIASLL